MTSPQDLDGLDPRHVFSEFDDPKREPLIKELVELDECFREVPCGNKLALWFADIDILRRAADHLQDEARFFISYSTAYFLIFL